MEVGEHGKEVAGHGGDGVVFGTGAGIEIIGGGRAGGLAPAAEVNSDGVVGCGDGGGGCR